MMKESNIITYLENEFRSFREFPPNEVDYAIFSMLSYFDYSVYMPLFGDSIPLKDTYDLRKNEAFLKRVAYSDNDRRLFLALVGNPRYKEVVALHYQSFFFERSNEQFAAVSFYLPNNEEVIGFRGTDSSFVGWKENFLMALNDPIESQIDAYKYLKNELASNDKKITIVGHSKGGNLASYAYFSLSDIEKERIKACYSFDGPGFSEEMLDRLNYLPSKDSYFHIVPKESIIGELYSHGSFQRIIDAKGRYFEMHSPYSWIVQNGSFVSVPFSNPRLKTIMNSFNDWAERVSEEDRKLFLDVLFEMIDHSGIANFKELLDFKINSGLKLTKAYKSLPEEEKKEFKRIGSPLIDIFKKAYFG